MRLPLRITLDMPVAHSSAANTVASLEPRRFGMWSRHASSPWPFSRAIRGQRWLPKYLSSDHDPLYTFPPWQANLRILEVTEIKTVPYVPLCHPFVERLIGTVRREYLDPMLFWTSADLSNQLLDFRTYFNHHRTHHSREERTPDMPVSPPVANLRSFR
jgi:putative transposase